VATLLHVTFVLWYNMLRIFALNFEASDNYQNSQCDPPKILIGDPWPIVSSVFMFCDSAIKACSLSKYYLRL